MGPGLRPKNRPIEQRSSLPQLVMGTDPRNGGFRQVSSYCAGYVLPLLRRVTCWRTGGYNRTQWLWALYSPARASLASLSGAGELGFINPRFYIYGWPIFFDCFLGAHGMGDCADNIPPMISSWTTGVGTPMVQTVCGHGSIVDRVDGCAGTWARFVRRKRSVCSQVSWIW